MKIYNFDAMTGMYIGESLADPSPLEPGKFLMPRFATDQDPPAEIAEGFAPFWRGDAWSVEPVPARDDDLNGKQDAPAGYAEEPGRPGYFVRLLRALVGK